MHSACSSGEEENRRERRAPFTTQDKSDTPEASKKDRISMGAFYQLGKLCSRAPVRVSLAALFCSLVLCLGLTRMRVQTDPQELWVPPTSVAAQEQARFNALFHPFFRVQQLIFYVDEGGSDGGGGSAANGSCSSNVTDDLVQRKYLLKMAEVETAISSVKVRSALFPNVTLALDEFCYKPIKGKGCLVTSPFQYWLSNTSLLESDPDIKLTTACQTTDPFLKEKSPCMDQNGVPVMRNVVFGGLSKDSCHENPDPCGEMTPQAKALMVTFLLHSNPKNETYTQLVQEWEQEVFLKIAQRAGKELRLHDQQQQEHQGLLADTISTTSFDGMRLTFMAQRSIADSLVMQTSQNAFIVVISYLVMFLYVSMSLGKFRDPIHSRFGLGMTGILIVLLSLGISMGICSALLQMEVTMITLEVVPFLILAIGVDNMFILTNEFDRLKVLRGLSTSALGSRDRFDDEDLLQQVLGETLSNVGPSILVAAVAECLAFVVGTLTKIPALESFCAVAAVAVLADFVLQITWFVSALVLDTKRVRTRRYDLWPFMRQTLVLSPDKYNQQKRRSGGGSGKYAPVATSDAASILSDRGSRSAASSFRSSSSSNGGNGTIKTFVTKKYTPFLMKRSTKMGVLVTTNLLFTISILGYRHIPLGLEQEMAVPTDFYLHKYFQMQTKYGEAGPIAYIVLEDQINYTDGHVQADLNRLLDQLSNIREYIQLPIYSWLHTFNQWRQMRFYLQEKIKGGLCDCPEQPMDPFPYELQQPTDGDSKEPNITSNDLFYPLVHNFTQIAIDSQCCQQYGLCGAQYEGDIIFTTKKRENETESENEEAVVSGVEASRFRFQVNAMKNQTMFINSYYYLHQVTRAWSAGRSTALGTAFPYVLYFVYYEQYTYIQGTALQSILLALAVVFMSIFVLMERNVRLSVIVSVCVLLMTVSQLGFIFAWNQLSSVSTSINAVSVVNLLACVGLGVEFCIHMAHQFAFSQKNKLGITSVDHTKHALSSVGASIISGITLTKFCGIGILAFAPSMLFRVYFFRMYMGIVVLGFFYGMVLLPVLLSLFGQRATFPDDLSSFLLSEEREDELEDEIGLAY